MLFTYQHVLCKPAFAPRDNWSQSKGKAFLAQQTVTSVSTSYNKKKTIWATNKFIVPKEKNEKEKTRC